MKEGIGMYAEGNVSEEHQAGSIVGAGTFVCVECDGRVGLQPLDEIPPCPICGGETFRRASIFEPEAPADQPTAVAPPIGDAGDEPDWLAERRAELTDGVHLLFEVGGEWRELTLEPGWIRVGRSEAAELRLPGPTVSRRHAVIVLTDEGELRILDDRSLNGVTVNGRSVDWGELADGDRIAIGCYTLHVVSPARREAPAEQQA